MAPSAFIRQRLLGTCVALCCAGAASAFSQGDAFGVIGTVQGSLGLAYSDGVQFVETETGGKRTGYMVRGERSGRVYVYDTTDAVAETPSMVFDREVADGGQGTYPSALAMARTANCLVIARGPRGATIATVKDHLAYSETAIVPPVRSGANFISASATGSQVALADATGYVVVITVDEATCTPAARDDVRLGAYVPCTPNDAMVVGGDAVYTGCAEGYVVVTTVGGAYETRVNYPLGEAVTRLTSVTTGLDGRPMLSAGSPDGFQLMDVTSSKAPSIDQILWTPLGDRYLTAVGNPAAPGIVYAASEAEVARVDARDLTALLITSTVPVAQCRDVVASNGRLYLVHGATLTAVGGLEAIVPPPPTPLPPTPPPRPAGYKHSPEYLASPEYTDTPEFEAAGGHYESPRFKGSPTYKEAPEYQAGPAYTDTPSFERYHPNSPRLQASPGYKDAPVYQASPALTDTPLFAGAGEAVRVGSPTWKATPEYQDSPQYTDTPLFAIGYERGAKYRGSPTYKASPQYTDTPLFESHAGRYEAPSFKESPTFKATPRAIAAQRISPVYSDTPLYAAEDGADASPSFKDSPTYKDLAPVAAPVDKESPAYKALGTKYVLGYSMRHAAMVMGAAAAVGATVVTGGGYAMRVVVVALPCDIADFNPALRFTAVFNPMQISIDGSDALGAVVSNVVILFVCAVLFAGLRALNQLLLEDFYLSMVQEVALQGFPILPSAAIVSAQLVYAGFALAAWEMVFHPPRWPVAIVGCVLLLGLFAVPYKIHVEVARRIQGHYGAIHTDEKARPGTIRQHLIGGGEWVDRFPNTLFASTWCAAVRPFAAHGLWYGTVEYGVLLALAAAHAVRPSTWAGCGHVKIASLAVFAVLIVLNGWKWPLIHTRASVGEVLTSGLCAAAMALMAVGYYSEDSDHACFDIGSLILVLAAGAQLCRVVGDVAATLYVMWTRRRSKLQTDFFAYREASGDHDIALMEMGPERSQRSNQTSPQRAPPAHNRYKMPKKSALVDRSASTASMSYNNDPAGASMSSIASGIKASRSVSFGPTQVSTFGDSLKKPNNGDASWKSPQLMTLDGVPMNHSVNEPSFKQGSRRRMVGATPEQRPLFDLPDVPLDETMDTSWRASGKRSTFGNQNPLKQQDSGGLGPPRRSHPSPGMTAGGLVEVARGRSASAKPAQRRMSDPLDPSMRAASQVQFNRVDSSYTPPPGAGSDSDASPSPQSSPGSPSWSPRRRLSTVPNPHTSPGVAPLPGPAVPEGLVPGGLRLSSSMHPAARRGSAERPASGSGQISYA